MRAIKSLLFLCIFLYMPVIANGQFAAGYGWVMPRESMAATITQTVGVTDVTIKYHRPSVNGRKIWGCQTADVVPKPGADYGCLVPNGQVWRAGANDATTIQFTTDVKLEGQPVAAGTYGLFMIPGAEQWTVALSKNSRQWGSFAYRQADDLVRVTVTPRPGENQERLEYDFPVVTNDSAEITLSWEKLKIPIKLTVDTAAQASAKARTRFEPVSGYFAADYYLQSKTRLDEGLKWINATLAFDENASNLMLKARILAEMKRYPEAVETGEKALALFKTRNIPITEQQKMIDEWKKPK